MRNLQKADTGKSAQGKPDNPATQEATRKGGPRSHQDSRRKDPTHPKAGGARQGET